MPEEKKKKEKRPQCTAKSKQTGERCKKPCVPGKKVCHWHGGRSKGAPKGNKNALKHGAFQRVDRLICFDDELKLVNGLPLDPIETLKEQIKILRIKELRIAKRMKESLIAESEAGKEDKDGKKKPGTVLLTVSTNQTQNFDGQTSKSVTSNSETHSMYYLRLEQVHTQLMAELRRALNNLANLEAEKANNEDNADKFVGVLVTPGILSDSEWEKVAIQTDDGQKDE